MFQTLAILSLCFASIITLDHEKSFLLSDMGSYVVSASVFRSSLLITASTDIIQKDIVTGATQRTFKAHTNKITSFIVTEDNRMITAGYDDMLIVWDLDTASIIKRIWLGASGTLIERLALQGKQVYVGGLDEKVRYVDLNSGSVLRTLRTNGAVLSVVVDEDHIYLSQLYAPRMIKLLISSGQTLMSFEGHTETVFVLLLHDIRLYSGSGDKTIIVWNKNDGTINRRYFGHRADVYTLIMINETLYSGDDKGFIVKWNMTASRLAKSFQYVHKGSIQCFTTDGQDLYSGSVDLSVIKWNMTSGAPHTIYADPPKKLMFLSSWKNFIIAAGENSQIMFWDFSANNLDPYTVLSEHTDAVNCLFVHEEFLFSGSTDNSIIQWNITSLLSMRTFLDHKSSVTTIVAEKSVLYSGANDFMVKKWNISNGDLLKDLSAHTYFVSSVRLDETYLFSSSFDQTIRLWDKESDVLVRSYTSLQQIYVICILGDSIIASFYGVEKFLIETGEKLVSNQELFGTFAMVSQNFRLFSGHSDNLLRRRDTFSLDVIETFQGHSDVVSSLCFDEAGVIYSTGSDGSIKKWNMASRRVAFSFEKRDNSVTSLAIIGSFLLVATKGGIVNVFSVGDGEIFKAIRFHNGTISSLVAIDQDVFSISVDGSLKRASLLNGFGLRDAYQHKEAALKSLLILPDAFVFIRNEFDVLFHPRNSSVHETRMVSSSVPILCIALSDNFLLAGSKSGVVLAWDIENLRESFNLKGHTSQVNYLLVLKSIAYSASDDKTIIQWSLVEKVQLNFFRRLSSAALGHLGPVNCMVVYGTVLFTGGSDLVIRRWNSQTGKHEGAYFGFTKPVNALLWYNDSLFAGSEDFSVLMFRPNLPLDRTYLFSSRASSSTSRSRGKSKIVLKLNRNETANFSVPLETFVIIPVVTLVTIAFLFFWSKRKTKTKELPTTEATSSRTETGNTATDLQTVVNTVMGVSKHASYLIENSAVVKINKIAAGGGGELYLSKIMDPKLKSKIGENVIQKIVFVRNKASEDAFYQEVGIMVMLSKFPYFCTILGYTENPLSMILKFYAAGSLASWLRNNALNRTVMIKVFREMALGLELMHSYYLAHCDIKPQNILVEVVNGEPSSVLTDFGITQILSERIIAAKYFKIMNLRGLSVNYASPEAFSNFRSKKYTRVDFKKYDVYSFACVLLEVLTSKAPWS